MTDNVSAEDFGSDRVQSAEMSLEHALRVAAVLDAEADLRAGSPLPLLWHWAFFTSPVPTAALGPDGHPRMRATGVTAGLPRRMWAGGRVRAESPLLIGESATRRSTVGRLERKSGRSGDMLIVTLLHEVVQGGRTVLIEEQDLVYRAPPIEPIPMPTGEQRPRAADGEWADHVDVGPAQLFRFSAVTFNSHRIHYDLPYATAGEGYPALVVHGPLTAVMLAESARRRGRSGTSFSFRATAPLFASVPFTLVGVPEGDAVALSAVRNDGTTAMTARISWPSIG